MKRKLVLTFDGNKLLHASITERGKRVRLPDIATRGDALKEVKDTLSSALVVVETASIAVSDSTVTVGNTMEPSSQALRFSVQEMLSVNGTAALGVGPGAPTCVVGPSSSLPADDATEQTTSVASMQEDTPRARAVCARPKSDKDKSPSPGSFNVDGGW